MQDFMLVSDGERSVILPMSYGSAWRRENPQFSRRSGVVEAESWLAAKRDLGFELTPLQQELLKKGAAQ